MSQENPVLHQLETIAWTVRFWAEGQAETRDPNNARDLGCWCAIASAELWRRCRDENIDVELCMGMIPQGKNEWCHVFVRYQDHVLDITATQFQGYRDNLVLIAHEREVSDNWFHTPTWIFATDKELIKWQKKTDWPKKQIAWKQ